MDIDSLLQGWQSSGFSVWLRNSPWRYPLIEIFHLTGLVLFFGTLLIVNLRLFGVVLKRQPASQVASDLWPWALTGLAIQFVSGPLMFIAEPPKYFDSTAFRFKLSFLVIALLVHFTFYRRSALKADEEAGRAKVAAWLSLGLWIGVILSGLAIELVA